ncbi:MAG: hypothetical protein HYX44_08015 [Aquabacterium sp.]|nr:hypothetical protein [Aquabacterium sp.]
MLSQQARRWLIKACAWWMLAWCAAGMAWAQIGCDPGSTRTEGPGPRSSACGVGSKHRMGSVENRRYWGDPSYGHGRYSSSDSTPVTKAADILPYLPARCAELNEAMRTAPARGVRADVQSQLRDEYRQKCGDEDEEARRRLSADRRASREAAAEARQAEQMQKQLNEQEQSRCHELQRILMSKRQRLPDMSEGEKGDLQRSEQAFKERCRR